MYTDEWVYTLECMVDGPLIISLGSFSTMYTDEWVYTLECMVDGPLIISLGCDVESEPLVEHDSVFGPVHLIHTKQMYQLPGYDAFCVSCVLTLFHYLVHVLLSRRGEHCWGVDDES